MNLLPSSSRFSQSRSLWTLIARPFSSSASALEDLTEGGENHCEGVWVFMLVGVGEWKDWD